MIALVEIILLCALGLFGILIVSFLRLLFEDSDAVEIDLREIEKQDFEVPLLRTYTSQTPNLTPKICRLGNIIIIGRRQEYRGNAPTTDEQKALFRHCIVFASPPLLITTRIGLLGTRIQG